MNSRHSNDLFNILLNDANKRALVLDLLIKEGLVTNGIPSFNNKSSHPLKRLQNSTVKKNTNKCHIESPSALHRRRALQKIESNSSTDEPETSESLDCSLSKSIDEILSGVVAYCEVKRNNGDCSNAIKIMMRTMGAVVRDNFSRDVTHVVFKDGSFNTYQKAKLLKVHLVSVLWLEAVRRLKRRVPESKYPAVSVKSHNANNLSFICEQMEKEYEEVINDECNKKGEFLFSAGRNSHTSQQDIYPFENEIEDISFQRSNCSTLSDSLRITPKISRNTFSSITSSSSSSNSSKNLNSDSNSNNMLMGKTNVKDIRNSLELKKSSIKKRVNCSRRLITDSSGEVSIENKSDSNLQNEEMSMNLRISDESHENTVSSKIRSNDLLNAFQTTPDNLRMELENISSNVSRTNVHDKLATPILVNKSLLKNSPKATKSTLTKTPVRKSSNHIKMNGEIKSTRRSVRKTIASMSEFNSHEEKLNVTNLSPQDMFLSNSLDTQNNSGNTNIKQINNDISSNKENKYGYLEKNFNSFCNISENIKSPENKKQQNNEIENKDRMLDKNIIKSRTRARKLYNVDRSLDETMFDWGNHNPTNDIMNNVKKTIKMPKSLKIPRTYTSKAKALLQDKNETSKNETSKKETSKNETSKNETSKNETSKNANISENTKKKSVGSRKSIRLLTRKTLNFHDDADGNDDLQVADVTPKKIKNKKLIEKNIDIAPNKRLKSIVNKTLKSPNPENVRESGKINSEIENIACTVEKNSLIITDKCLANVNISDRRSTLEFEQRPSRNSLARIKLSQKPKQTIKLSSIVCTHFHKNDVLIFEQIVNKLGGFIIEDEVTGRTTHLVAASPSRTINMLRAISRGCWVVKRDWLYKSLEAGKWVEEEDYEMIEFSISVQKCRLQKQAFGSRFSLDIFRDCGNIFVARGSVPRASDLEELIVLCGGSVVKSPRQAKIVVGEFIEKDDLVCLNEKWILECISNNKKKTFKHFIMNRRTSESY